MLNHAKCDSEVHFSPSTGIFFPVPMLCNIIFVVLILALVLGQRNDDVLAYNFLNICKKRDSFHAFFYL